MVELGGRRRREETDDTVVTVFAANHWSGQNFYLEPGEYLEIVDDGPSRVKIEVAEALE